MKDGELLWKTKLGTTFGVGRKVGIAPLTNWGGDTLLPHEEARPLIASLPAREHAVASRALKWWIGNAVITKAHYSGRARDDQKLSARASLFATGSGCSFFNVFDFESQRLRCMIPKGSVPIIPLFVVEESLHEQAARLDGGP